MIAAQLSAIEAPKWRRILFIAVLTLVAVVFAVGFGAIFALLAPWAIVPIGPSEPNPELHRWHSVQMAATFGLIFAGSLVALLWRSEDRPIVAQFFIAGSMIFGAAIIFFAPEGIVVLAFGAMVAALYPARRQLLINPWTGPKGISPPRLAVALLTAVFLAPEAARMLLWQIDGAGGEHAEFTHWGLAFALDLVLIFAGLLAASKRPGSHALAVITGLTFLYLGAAALTIPNHDGSWGVTGGVVATMAGVVYLATVVVDRRHSRSLSAARG